MSEDHEVAGGPQVASGETATSKPGARRRARMSDVAKVAGVSTTTVSLVLSGKAGSSIPAATQERVVEASRRLGYRTNALARGLRLQSTDTIGLISDVIASTPFAGAMIHGAHQAAAIAGKLLLIVNTERDRAVESKAIDTMHARRVDGIIYATMFHRVIEPPYELKEAPWVVLDSRTTDPGDSWVVPDEEGGGHRAAMHLIEAGHRRIGYLSDVHHHPADVERLEGYQRALGEAGIPFDPTLVVEDRDHPFGGHAAAARLLERDDPPTALQCYNDRMAMGAYRAVRRAGLTIPDDISIIGFDNQDQIAPWLDPPLTTVQLPHEEMGRWAVEHLTGVLSGSIEGPRQHRMDCPLVVRGSVAPPRDRAGGADPTGAGDDVTAPGPATVTIDKHGARRKKMIGAGIRPRLAILATAAMVGAALTVTPVVAQGDLNVCDGEFEGPVTLDFTVWQGSHADVYQESVDAFNAGPGAEMGVTVALNYIPETEYERSIVAQGASGELPDILGMDGPFLYNFAWNGFLRPIDSCISEETLAGFLPSVVQQGTYEDQLYSLGSIDSGLGLWAHKSMLEEVGARIPASPDDAWTAEEFTQVLKDLKAAGKGANGPLDIKWFYGAGEWRPYGFAPMVQSAGGDIIDRSTMASVEGFFNGPEAVGAWTTFQGWVNDGLIDLVAEDDSNFTVGPDGQPNTSDETPISWVGHWMYPLYSENADDLILLPLPDFGNGSKTGMGSWNWAVTTGADGAAASGDEVDLDAVWAFFDWLISPSEVDRIAQGEGAVPATLEGLAASSLHQEGGPMHMYVVNLENAHTDTSLVQSGAVPRPATPAYGVIRDAFSDALADIIAGGDVQSTLDTAAQMVDQEIEDAGYAE